MVSKVWVGMSTTNVHLLQFKIQSHFQKNVDFECRYIRTHSEGKGKKQNKTKTNKQTNKQKQKQKQKQKTKQKQNKAKQNKAKKEKKKRKKKRLKFQQYISHCIVFSSKFFHFNCHLEYETIRSTGKMVHSNTKNASSSISSVLLTHNQYICP